MTRCGTRQAAVSARIKPLEEKLPSIQQQHPELVLRAEANSATERLKRLEEGIIDLALLFEPVELPDVTAKPLGKFRLLLAVRWCSAQAWSALGGWPALWMCGIKEWPSPSSISSRYNRGQTLYIKLSLC